MPAEPQPPENQREEQLDAWLALTGQVPAPVGPVILPMLSGSMAPAIPIGAQLQIVVQTATGCQAGDVAVFLDGDKLTAHRILWAGQVGPWTWLLEKGDANPAGRWRRQKDIRGRVIGYLAEDQSWLNPSDPTLASQGLRAHWRHWLKTCSGLKSKNLTNNEKQS
jgi:hypothetical protein